MFYHLAKSFEVREEGGPVAEEPVAPADRLEKVQITFVLRQKQDSFPADTRVASVGGGVVWFYLTALEMCIPWHQIFNIRLRPVR